MMPHLQGITILSKKVKKARPNQIVAKQLAGFEMRRNGITFLQLNFSGKLICQFVR